MLHITLFKSPSPLFPTLLQTSHTLSTAYDPLQIFLRDSVSGPYLHFKVETKIFEERFPLEDTPRGHRMQDHTANARVAP